MLLNQVKKKYTIVEKENLPYGNLNKIKISLAQNPVFDSVLETFDSVYNNKRKYLN